MDKDNSYEIPFGAKDSELKGWEYTIPEGMEAEIKDGKIIVREKESEDERIRKRLIEWVEEFRKLNPTNADHNAECSEAISWLEKQGSQNLANSTKTCKVEPKFKVGDFIADIYCKGKVIELTDDSYLLDTGQGIPFSCEHNTHLWTIQDAKVGDVLYSKKGRGVETIDLVSGWKKVDGENALCSVCTYRIEDDEILTGGLGAIWWDGVQDPFCPATKEQCELLFQKMKEAGYEWDAEKKELKKIEQNPAWSEEDEKMAYELHRACCACESEFNSDMTKEKDWLKSLKDRVQPQSKQEWSEDDKEALRVVTNIFEQHGVKLLCYPAFVHWLKTLPNRITLNPYWKPSDKQMKQLGLVVKLNKDTLIGDGLMTLFNDLKNLKG